MRRHWSVDLFCYLDSSGFHDAAAALPTGPDVLPVPPARPKRSPTSASWHGDGTWFGQPA
jgi:hypothetical protein